MALNIGEKLPEDTFIAVDPGDDWVHKKWRQIDEHFEITAAGLFFRLNPVETSAFELSDLEELGDLITFQIALKAAPENFYRLGAVEIVNRADILVLDSLYNDILPYRGPCLCSESTYVSNKTICRN